jgi:hypothetical protein
LLEKAARDHRLGAMTPPDSPPALSMPSEDDESDALPAGWGTGLGSLEAELDL